MRIEYSTTGLVVVSSRRRHRVFAKSNASDDQGEQKGRLGRGGRVEHTTEKPKRKSFCRVSGQPTLSQDWWKTGGGGKKPRRLAQQLGPGFCFCQSQNQRGRVISTLHQPYITRAFYSEPFGPANPPPGWQTRPCSLDEAVPTNRT